MGRMMYIVLRTSYSTAVCAIRAYVQILWRGTLNAKQIKEIAAPALVGDVGNIKDDLSDNAHGWYSIICYGVYNI